MSLLRTLRVTVGASALALLALTGCGPSEPKLASAPPDMRRLTDEQYHNIVVDLFGPDLEIAVRGDPLTRTDGLLAVGARTAQISPSGFEQYYTMGKSIAAQVTSPRHRNDLIPCRPKSETAADDACATEFFTHTGRLLYRRPLTDGELKTMVSAAREMAEASQDFYRGIALGLGDMMVTPKFLFIIDETQPSKKNPGEVELTPYAKASRLSFLLWNTTPNDELLDAAAKGEFDSASGVKKHVERMMASTRLHTGVRAFFEDFFALDKFETLEKDSIIYKAYTTVVGKDAEEQILRTVSDHVITRNLDYRDIFVTKRTFMTGALARLYHVRVERPDGAWIPYEFAPDDGRAGILTQVGFNAMASHPGRSSPTLRGKAIRESMLCQHVPDPPGDVDFTSFEDPNSPNKTARQRLDAHSVQPACAGCHKITDPIGLALEHFDGVGQLRFDENGEKIDTGGDLDGTPYTDALGLGKAMRDHPAVSSCVVRRLWAYATGRPVDNATTPYVNYLDKSFSKNGYRLPELLEQIATSDAFYAVGKPAAPATAMLTTPEGGRGSSTTSQEAAP